MSKDGKIAGRYVYKTYEVYKGVKFECRGTSCKSRAEAKLSWSRRLQKKCSEIDNDVEEGNKEKKSLTQRRVDQREAEEKKERLKMKKEQHIFSDEIYKWYQLYMVHSGREKRTVRTDYDTIEQLSKSPFSNTEVSVITSDEIQSYLVSLANMGLSQSTIKKRKNMLAMYFRYARPDDDPIRRCVIPKSDKMPEEKDAYSDEEIKKLTEQLRKPYNPSGRGIDRGSVHGRMLLIILYEYLRISEALELRTGDVDLQHGILHVSRQYDEETHEIKDPKYNSVRTLPIAAEVWEIFEDVTKNRSDDELLFPAGMTLNSESRSDDRHIRCNNLRACLESTEKLLGLPRHTVHDLRHDGISLFVRRGISAPDISKFAGHKSVSFTMERYYRHTSRIDENVIYQISGRKCACK